MFKTTIAAAAAAVAFAPAAALAGPYVNVETNAGWTGDDYTGATTDIHVGYEGDLGAGSFYVQAGPAIVSEDGEESDTCLLYTSPSPRDGATSRMPSSA